MSLISDNGVSGYLKSRFKSYAWGLNAEKVDKDGVVASINLSKETVKIQGERLEFAGAASFNNNVFIDMDGKIHAVDGEFNGTIDSSSGNIGGWDILSNSLRADSFDQGGFDYRTHIQKAFSDNSIVFGTMKRTVGTTTYSFKFSMTADGSALVQNLSTTEGVDVGGNLGVSGYDIHPRSVI